MVGKQGKANRHRVDAIASKLRHENQITPGLRHLVTLPGHHAGVHVVPGIGPGIPEYLRLGGAHLMMWKCKVAATTLYINRHTQIIKGNCHALDMPARATMA